MSGQADDLTVAEAETIAEALQAIVDERRAHAAEDYWHALAEHAEAELAEQRSVDQSHPC